MTMTQTRSRRTSQYLSRLWSSPPCCTRRRPPRWLVRDIASIIAIVQDGRSPHRKSGDWSPRHERAPVAASPPNRASGSAGQQGRVVGGDRGGAGREARARGVDGAAGLDVATAEGDLVTVGAREPGGGNADRTAGRVDDRGAGPDQAALVVAGGELAPVDPGGDLE